MLRSPQAFEACLSQRCVWPLASSSHGTDKSPKDIQEGCEANAAGSGSQDSFCPHCSATKRFCSGVPWLQVTPCCVAVMTYSFAIAQVQPTLSHNKPFANPRLNLLLLAGAPYSILSICELVMRNMTQPDFAAWSPKVLEHVCSWFVLFRFRLCSLWRSLQASKRSPQPSGTL